MYRDLPAEERHGHKRSAVLATWQHAKVLDDENLFCAKDPKKDPEQRFNTRYMLGSNQQYVHMS